MVGDVDGAAWDHPMDQHGRSVKQVFDGVHGQARPRADIDVAVMERVHTGVEERHMQQAVDPVEMEGGPDGKCDDDGAEQERVVGERGNVTVRHEPKGDALECSDLEHAAGEGPEHVVFDLVAEFEGSVFAHHITVGEFERLVLGFARVEIPMQATCEGDHDDEVGEPDLGDPADGECFGGFE